MVDGDGAVHLERPEADGAAAGVRGHGDGGQPLEQLRGELIPGGGTGGTGGRIQLGGQRDGVKPGPQRLKQHGDRAAIAISPCALGRGGDDAQARRGRRNLLAIPVRIVCQSEQRGLNP